MRCFIQAILNPFKCQDHVQECSHWQQIYYYVLTRLDLIYEVYWSNLIRSQPLVRLKDIFDIKFQTPILTIVLSLPHKSLMSNKGTRNPFHFSYTSYLMRIMQHILTIADFFLSVSLAVLNPRLSFIFGQINSCLWRWL